MLGYVLRVLPVVLSARRDGKLVSKLTRRVGLHELDFNRHMNQAIYPQVCELGRADWLLRSGAWGRWRGAGINPIVAEQHLTYRRELAPFQRYTIDTRSLRVEGRFLWVQAVLHVGERVHAKNDVKLLFVGPQGVLAPDAVADACTAYLTEPLKIEDWRILS